VTELKPGDRVAYAQTPNMGGYAELNAVPTRELVPVPDGVSDQDACAVMLQGITAHYLVRSTFPLQAGQTALVHAAAGGVGSTLVQLAKLAGATVIATVGTEEKAELARGYGADHVIVYANEDFAEATRKIAGEHAVDVVYDSVGKDTWERSLSLLRPRGMLVIFGASSGAVPPIDPQKLSAAGSVFFTRPTLVDYIRTRDELLSRTSDLYETIRSGKLHVRIGTTPPHTCGSRSSGGSFGPPLRTFADTASSRMATICRASSSPAVGRRSSARRPGMRRSTTASAKRTFSSGSSTTRAAPCTTTER
jgi:NADPH2:quinone reductase